jgi:myosin-5
MQESRLPSGSETSLLSKYFQNFAEKSKNEYFTKPRFAGNSFAVRHYAHDVSYEVEGFIEKNKDTVSEELLILLSRSKCDLLREILEKKENDTSEVNSIF